MDDVVQLEWFGQRGRVLEAGLWAGCSWPVAEAAQRNVDAGVAGLAVSGAMGSGKDTIAAAVMREVTGSVTGQLSFAGPLRGEVSEILRRLRGPDPLPSLRRMGFSDSVIGELRTRLGDVARDPEVTGRTRIPEIRWALQYVGTDVRRANDPSYWVRRAAASVVTQLAGFDPVSPVVPFVTDMRWANEADVCRSLGMMVVRVEVDPEIRAARIAVRDGAAPTTDALHHRSEKGLDGYTDWDLRVGNNGDLADAVAVVAAEYRTRFWVGPFSS